jgi:hypothetical protein
MNLQQEFEEVRRGQKEVRDLILGYIASEPKQSLKWLDLNGLSDYLPSKPAHATIYGWLSNGSIPAHKQGNRWIFSVCEIDNWIRQGKKKTLSELEAENEEYLSNRNKGLK